MTDVRREYAYIEMKVACAEIRRSLSRIQDLITVLKEDAEQKEDPGNGSNGGHQAA